MGQRVNEGGRRAALTVGSLFAGIGGFDLGLERAGFRIAWQVEREPTAQAILRKHWPDVPLHDDVVIANGGTREQLFASCRRQQEQVLPRMIPAHERLARARRSVITPVDLLVGGFPCQDVSVAGQRRGLAGNRTGLFWQVLRIADELNVGMVLLENVPGLLTSHGGRDFHTVLAALAERGFHDRAYRILDSRYFGVAQRRRRVFIVGCRGTEYGRARAILFESESGGGRAAAGREAGAHVAATSGGGAAGDGSNPSGRGGGEAEADIAFCLRADPGGIGQGHNTNFVTGWQQSRRRMHGVMTMDARQAPAVSDAVNTHTVGTLCADMGGGNQFATSGQMVAVGVHANQRGELRESPLAGSLTAARSGKQFEGVMAFDWQSGGDVRHNVGPQTSALTSNQTPAVFATLTASGHSTRGDGSDNLVASSGESARTLTASMHKGHDDDTDTMIVRGGVRRLTPTECERLQAFPDGWTCTCGVQPYTTATCRCPDTPRYKGLGNAVTASVAEWIGRRAHAVLLAARKAGAA